MSKMELENKPNDTDVLLRYAQELGVQETENMGKLRQLFTVAQDQELTAIAAQYQDLAQQMADRSPSPTLTHNILVSILYSSQRVPESFMEALNDTITVSIHEGRDDVADQLTIFRQDS